MARLLSGSPGSAGDSLNDEDASAEAGFRATFERAPVGMGHADLDGRFFRVNRRFCEILGYTREELLARSFQDITHPDDLAPDLGLVERALSGEIETYNMEKRYLHKNGRTIWVSLSVSLLKRADGRPDYFLSVVEDITARRRAAESLRDTEERLRMAAGAGKVGLWDWDVQANAIYYSPEWKRQIGYEDVEITNDPGEWQDRVHPEDREASMATFRATLAGAGPDAPIEFRLRHRDGSYRWILARASLVCDERGRPLRLVGANIDITERRQAEERARNERDTIRRIVESGPVGMAMMDREGRIVVANSRCEQTLQLTRDPSGAQAYEAPRWKITDYAGHPIPEGELPFERVRATGQPVRDVRYALELEDGRRVLLSVNAAPLVNADGFDGVVAAYEDVTGLPEAERVAASARRRATILESISDAFVALDRDWRYTYVNRRAAELFGREPEALVGRHIWTEFPEGVGQPFYHAYQKAMNEGVPVQLEDFYTPWGRWYENRIYPSDDGLSIYFTDISPRKWAEQLLVGQKRVLEMIARGAPLRETLDALVGVVEEQSTEMLGSILLLDEDGVHLRHGAAPRLPESFTRAIDGSAIGAGAGSCGTAAFRANAVVVEDIELDPLWQDYRALAAPHGLRACWSTPIFDADRRVLGTFALYFRQPGRPTEHHLRLIDMATHTAAIAIVRQREEERLRASEGRYRELSVELEHRVVQRTAELNAKNRELETFTHSVSHDLKAPLRGIDGYSRLLLEDHAGVLNEEGRSFLRNVREATGQMGRLIDDLLAYSRLERSPVQPGRVELRPLVDGLVADRAPEIAARGAVVTVDIPDVVVSADRQGLVIAMRNLLENALKFTRDAAAPRIEIGARIDATACLVWVRDNGIGFDMRFHDRIFEVFQRLHRAEEYPGTGVGLAMVRRALERMGGRVRAESEVGKGATFFLEIPRPA